MLAFRRNHGTENERNRRGNGLGTCADDGSRDYFRKRTALRTAQRSWHTMTLMSKQLEAVYENGVLRPCQPLGLADQQHVLVTVDEIIDYKAWAAAQLRELGTAPG